MKWRVDDLKDKVAAICRGGGIPAASVSELTRATKMAGVELVATV